MQANDQDMLVGAIIDELFCGFLTTAFGGNTDRRQLKELISE
mgnify:CR=1 FL=1